jgi:phosphoglycolate phosphatase
MGKAMSETGVDAKSTVMNGDTFYDIEIARNARTLEIGVTWDYHHVEELIEAGAHRIVNTYDQLPQAIDDLLRAKA